MRLLVPRRRRRPARPSRGRGDACPGSRRASRIDFVVANCENASGGKGIDPRSAEELLDAGVDVLTSGNHIWQNREIIPYMRESESARSGRSTSRRLPGSGLDGRQGAPIGYAGRRRESDRARVHGSGGLSVSSSRGGAAGRAAGGGRHSRRHARRGDVGEGRHGVVSGRQGVGGRRESHARADRRRAVLPGGTAYLDRRRHVWPEDSVIGVRTRPGARAVSDADAGALRGRGGPVIVQGAFIDVDETTGRATAIRRLRERVDV